MKPRMQCTPPSSETLCRAWARTRHRSSASCTFCSASCGNGPGDSLTRLYCMVSTVLRGPTAMVRPEDGDLSVLLIDVLADLEEAIAFFQSCIALIAPLERLPDPPRYCRLTHPISSTAPT